MTDALNDEDLLKHYVDGYVSFQDAIKAGGVIYALSEARTYSRPDMATGPYTRALAAGMLDAALTVVQARLA